MEFGRATKGRPYGGVTIADMEFGRGVEGAAPYGDNWKIKRNGMRRSF